MPGQSIQYAPTRILLECESIQDYHSKAVLIT